MVKRPHPFFMLAIGMMLSGGLFLMGTRYGGGTGTGIPVAQTAPTFTTSIAIGSAGVLLSDDGDGALTILGQGDGSDEDLTLNLDDTANEGTFSSSTGLVTLGFTGIGLQVAGQVGSTVTTVDLDGVTAFPITRNVHTLTCEGAETITTITGGFSGQLLTIIHEDSDCTLNDTDDDTADQLDLLGANGDLAGAADQTIQLLYNGAHWFEVSRSIN